MSRTFKSLTSSLVIIIIPVDMKENDFWALEILNQPSLLTSSVLPDTIFPHFKALVFKNTSKHKRAVSHQNSVNDLSCIELWYKKDDFFWIKLSSETSSVASFSFHYANRHGWKGEDNNSFWKTFLLFNQISLNRDRKRKDTDTTGN